MAKRTYLWGSGQLATVVMPMISADLAGVVDGDAAKWGRPFTDYTILPPHEVIADDAEIIIASISVFPIAERIRAELGPDIAVRAASATGIASVEQTQALLAKHRAHLDWIETIKATELATARPFGQDRAGHLRFAAAHAKMTGLVLEFGVFQGASLTILQTTTDQKAFGFVIIGKSLGDGSAETDNKFAIRGYLRMLLAK